MSEVVHRDVATNGITMHVAEAGQGPLVVLCHGFPELWYSWRHQLPALAAAGYRVVAPDMRGYGRTSAPSHPSAYDFATLTADMTGLLDALGPEDAVFVGHDWGAALVWHVARAVPSRVRAVANLSVPYFPPRAQQRAPATTAPAPERFVYTRYFQEVGVADEELARDPRLTISRFFWSISGEAGRALKPEAQTFLDWLSDPPSEPAWLTAEDLDYYAGEFARTGFTGGLNWYRNGARNAEVQRSIADEKVRRPALFVAGDKDPVVRGVPLDVMAQSIPDLRGTVILPGCGHWTQQERPAEVNDALLSFLGGLGD